MGTSGATANTGRDDSAAGTGQDGAGRRATAAAGNFQRSRSGTSNASQMARQMVFASSPWASA